MRLVEERTNENGVTAVFYDCSKKVAGDRWLVRLECEIRFPVTDDLAALIDGDRDDKPAILAEIGSHCLLRIAKERNFVDERQMPEIFGGLYQDVVNHVLPYLDKPLFARNFFLQQVSDIRLQQYKVDSEATGSEELDEEGPADFSSCFVDTP